MQTKIIITILVLVIGLSATNYALANIVYESEKPILISKDLPVNPLDGTLMIYEEKANQPFGLMQVQESEGGYWQLHMPKWEYDDISAQIDDCTFDLTYYMDREMSISKVLPQP